MDVDPETGIVGQMPERCLGCRYCMTACPYHARYFNWWDPAWPAGMEKTLNPDVAPRMRGVVEKCNFCHGRLHAAKTKAAAAGKREIDPADYVPACVEACPAERHHVRRPERRAQPGGAGWRTAATPSGCWSSSAPIRRFTTAPRAPWVRQARRGGHAAAEKEPVRG